MHIRRLDIQNFRAIFRQALQFTDSMERVRPVTVLAGPNGSGKTSILFAIVQALRGAMRARISDIPAPSDDDIHRAEPSGRHPVTTTVEIELEFGADELASIEKVFKVTWPVRGRISEAELNPPALPEDRLTVRWQYPPQLLSDGSLASKSELRSYPERGDIWLAGAQYAWGGWKSRLFQDVREMYPIGVLRVFPQTRDRRWGIDIDGEGEETNSNEHFLSVIGPRNGGPEEPTVYEALSRLGVLAHGQGISEHDDRRRWEETLQWRFNQICAPKEYLGYWLDHPRYGETPLLKENGNEYPLRTAASGEIVILHYLTKLTFPRPVNNSLILIDEPELHLHPRWIRQIYGALPRMGQNNQFIMTTHSPELRQLAAEDNALIDLGNLGEPAESVAGA